MSNYKEPKLFGKDEDGEYLGMIEQIGTSRNGDLLMIGNRKPNLWIFSLLNGYRQIGSFKLQPDFARSNIPQLNKFNEDDLVIVTKKDGKIVNVKKDK